MTPVTLVRFGLPALLVSVGVALTLVGDDAAVGAGVVLIGCAALVGLANLLVRFSVGEMEDRARDQEARDFYSEHGRWPDDEDPALVTAPPPPPQEPGRHPGIISRPAGDREGRTRSRRPRRPPRRPRPGP